MEEIRYLILTILIELSFALLILRKERLFFVLGAVVCVNLISHPIAWQLVTNGYSWFGVECAVTLFEMAYFALLFRARWKNALAAACVMNVVSACVGMLI